jgi:hypothetical protein
MQTLTQAPDPYGFHWSSLWFPTLHWSSLWFPLEFPMVSTGVPCGFHWIRSSLGLNGFHWSSLWFLLEFPMAYSPIAIAEFPQCPPAKPWASRRWVVRPLAPCLICSDGTHAVGVHAPYARLVCFDGTMTLWVYMSTPRAHAWYALMVLRRSGCPRPVPGMRLYLYKRGSGAAGWWWFKALVDYL